MKKEATAKAAVVGKQSSGPWDDAAFAQLREWDPAWADAGGRMATNPWTSEILPRKTIELICIAVNAACTNLNQDGTRRHIRGALDAGATREEILTVLKMASLLGIHSCSLGAPILLEEAKTAGVEQQRADSSVRQGARDRSMEYGLGSVFQPGPVVDRAGDDRRFAGLYGCADPPKAGGIIEHRVRRLLHAHVRARDAAPYQGRAEAGCDGRGNHGSVEALRCARRSGL